jgi:hypothetical protein
MGRNAKPEFQVFKASKPQGSLSWFILGRRSTRFRDSISVRLEAIRPTRTEYEFRAALREQERSRLPDSAAGARDYDYLVIDSRHEVFLSNFCDFNDSLPCFAGRGYLRALLGRPSERGPL